MHLEGVTGQAPLEEERHETPAPLLTRSTRVPVQLLDHLHDSHSTLDGRRTKEADFYNEEPCWCSGSKPPGSSMITI
jgi:hypothetical protein